MHARVCTCPNTMSAVEVSEACMDLAVPVGSQDRTAEVGELKSGPTLAASSPGRMPSGTRHWLQDWPSNSASGPPTSRGSGTTSTLMSRPSPFPAPQTGMLKHLDVTWASAVLEHTEIHLTTVVLFFGQGLCMDVAAYENQTPPAFASDS